MKLIARIAVVALALAAFCLLPFVAAVQAFRGVGEQSRAYRAAVLVDQAMSVLSGGADESLLSQRAAVSGGAWRVLAWLLEAGWPGHLERYRG